MSEISTQSTPMEHSLDRRLERATRYVSQMWIPPNPQQLVRIEAGLDEGRYDLDLEFLLHDLKSDVSLFLYCLKELGLQCTGEGERRVSFSDPLEVLKQAGMERIKKVLHASPRSISQHDASSMSSFQATRLEASILSATTAELLAQHHGVKPNQAFLCALLRQLGLMLIAWNYPSVYRRAISASSTEPSLDSTLIEVLGFSPLTLAVAVVKDWGLAPEIRLAIGDAGDPCVQEGDAERLRETAAVAEGFKRLCLIGEALARANYPEHFPTALHDWKQARAQLERYLGKESLLTIQERVNEYCAGYHELSPALFERSKSLNPERHIFQHAEHKLLKRNRAVELCSPELRNLFKEFYQKSNNTSDPKEQLNFLLKHIIPFAGFSGGRVYTLDPGTAALSPRLSIGRVLLKDSNPVTYSSNPEERDPVINAFHCSTCVVGRSSHNETAYITGALGNQERIGVLYVEIPKQQLEEDENVYLIHFKAIRCAFEDCLGLG